MVFFKNFIYIKLTLFLILFLNISYTYSQCVQPTGTDSSNCGEGTVPLIVSGSTGFYNWYDAAAGGVPIDTGSLFQTPVISSTTSFYVSEYDTGATTNALFFDGVNDYVSIQDLNYSTANSIPELTVEAWVRTTYSGGAFNENWAIVDFDRSEYYNLFVDANGTVGFSTADPSAGIDDFNSTTIVNDGDWHHIVVVYDGVNKYIYIDGLLDETKLNPHGGNALGTGVLTRYGFLGDGSEADTENGGRNNLHYDGDIGEVRIWSDVRTATEINNNRFNCVIGPQDNLVLYYRMDGSGVDNTITDYSGNGYTGDLNSMTLPGAWISTGPSLTGCPNCESSRDEVVASILETPLPDLGRDTCVSSALTLDAGANYDSYLWNTGETSRTISADTSGFYSVEVDSAGLTCSGSDGISVSILLTPNGSDTSRCGPGSVNLSVSGSTGNYFWYDKSDSLVGAGSSYTTPVISETDTFFVSSFDNEPSREALSFDGIDDYVALNMFYSNGEVSELTVEAWVKTDISGATDNSNWAIIDFDRSNFYNLFVRGDDGRVGFATSAAGTTTDDFYSVTSVNDGDWHHVVGVYNGTDKFIYVDGVLDNTRLDPHNGEPLGTGGARYGFIGDGSEAGGINGARNEFYFEGEIDEVRVWSDVRNIIEIQNNKDICLTGTESNLEAYYKMVDGTGSSNLTDQSGNNRDGTLYQMDVNSVWINSGPEIDCSCGESDKDTVEVVVNIVPTVDLGVDTCVTDSLVLDAGPGFSDYQWQTGTTNQTYKVENSRSIWVSVDSVGTPCPGGDTIIVSVGIAAPPTPIDSVRCGNGSIELTASGLGEVSWWDQEVGGTLLGTGDTLEVGPLTSDSVFYLSNSLASREALRYNGAGQYVAIEDFTYNSTGIPEVTVEAWIKTSSSADQIIAAYDRNEYWRLEIGGSSAGPGQIGFCLLTSAGQLDFGGVARVDDGDWHHIAAVYDNGTASIYIDGVLDNDTTSGVTFGSGNLRYGFLGVGSEGGGFDFSPGPTDYFIGDMDEFRLWSSARSQAEIDTYKDSCLVGDEVGLDIYYRKSQGSGTQLRDFANSNNGLIKGPTWITDALPFNCSECGESDRIAVNATINSSISSTSSSTSCPGASGTRVYLEPFGGSGSFDYKELTGIFNYDGTFDSGIKEFTLPNSGSYSFEIADENDCLDTVSSVTTKAFPTGIASSSTTGNACLVPGNNEWYYITNASNQVVVGINAKDTDLGPVEASMYLNGTATKYLTEAYMRRSFVITPDTQPTVDADVRLYFRTSDYNNLQDSANAISPSNDDISSIADLGVTKYQGPTEDGVFDPSDATFLNFIAQNTNATQFGASYIELTVAGFSEFWIHASETLEPLPIELLSFDVFRRDNDVVIEWVTAVEINNDFFVVEKSVNGSDFKEVAKVNGAGNSSSEIYYQVIDQSPSEGTVYYRLKQVDFGGDYSYSKIVLLEDSNVNSNPSVSVYPNPAKDLLNIKLNNFKGEESILIAINSIAGVNVLNLNGALNRQGNGLVTVDIGNNIAPGIYFVSCFSNKDKITRKIIIE